MSAPISPATALAHVAPEFFESLSEIDRLVVPYMYDLWLRPEQLLPSHDWTTCGQIAGRGYGKSFTLAEYVNRCVERGLVSHVALMAPNEDRVEEVQVKFLVDLSPPWFKAERYRGGVRWPNGVQATAFTPLEPDRPRSENIGLSWACELVDWPRTKMIEAWDNLTTATRIDLQQTIWDTTSKGLNALIQKRLRDHASDPHAYPIRRGATFDNPLLSRKYLRDARRRYGDPTSRRYREELLGETFTGSAGAHWNQDLIDRTREPSAPEFDHFVVAVDPAQSTSEESDETGIVGGGRGRANRHVFITDDLSGKHEPAKWGSLVLDLCERRKAAGVLVETNRGGNAMVHVITSECRTREVAVSIVGKNEPIPPRREGTLYIKPVHTPLGKSARAEGPATETEAGRLHIVGELPELEHEFSTYEPGGASPNRYDAAVYVAIELAGLDRETPKDARADVRAATVAHEKLRTGLARVIPGRRVGL